MAGGLRSLVQLTEERRLTISSAAKSVGMSKYDSSITEGCRTLTATSRTSPGSAYSRRSVAR